MYLLLFLFKKSRTSRALPALLIAMATFFFSASVVAQTINTQKKPQPRNGGADEVSISEADRLQKERQLQARSLLISLASDAKAFNDYALRARSLARIADALWDVDADSARELFRKAWEAGDTADHESKEPLNLRRQILAVAARRDRALAEEFLQKLKSGESNTSSPGPQRSLWALPQELEQRLGLAESLLRNGDIKRALDFAAPVLSNVTISTIDFLTQLRGKDPLAADELYVRMLMSAANNTITDANTVSLLSSYIFTPQTYVVFNRQGAADTSWAPTSMPPANVSPQLRLSFFQIAGNILLQPQPPPEQDQTTSGLAGKFMVVKRLLPLFDLYAPKEITTVLHSQFEALSSQVTAELRNVQTESLERGIAKDKSLSDLEQPLLDQLDRAKTSSERDELYLRLALAALNKDDVKARTYVSEIEDGDFRKRAQAWIDWGLAIRAIKKNQFAGAIELTRKGELTHIQRVWVLTQSIKSIVKTDREKATSLLDEASSEAKRIDASDVDRPRAMFALANVQNVIDSERAWDALFEAVKAANSCEVFLGEGGALNQTLSSRSQILTSREPVPDFDVRGIFGDLAKTDYDRAVGLARAFQKEAPRAIATIAIARTVLNDKNSSISAR